MAYEPLRATITFRLRQDERELLEEAADASDRRLSDWLRFIAVHAAKLEHDLRVYDQNAHAERKD